MATNPHLSNAAANAAADAMAPLLNGGMLKIYSAPQAATADTAITTQTLLATVSFANPAFSASVAGVATANALTADSNAAATGDAAWCRALTSGGATVFDGSCGTSNADCLLSSTSIVVHGTVSITACTLTVRT